MSSCSLKRIQGTPGTKASEVLASLTSMKMTGVGSDLIWSKFSFEIGACEAHAGLGLAMSPRITLNFNILGY